MLKEQKGITLLNLIFVILIMLTLAAIAIAMVLDQYNNDTKPTQVEYVAEQTIEPSKTPDIVTSSPEVPQNETSEPNNETQDKKVEEQPSQTQN